MHVSRNTTRPPRTRRGRLGWAWLSCALLVLAAGSCCGSSFAIGQLAPVAAPTSQPQAVQDSLGRTTPRGTVLGFLTAARKGDDATAAYYLNTSLNPKQAAQLAHELFVVLNRRLPANLNQLNHRPEGSLANPLQPDIELIGTVPSSNGDVDIELERVDRGKNGSLWLFSRNTLKVIPGLYQEVDTEEVANVLPSFLTETRFANVPLFELLAIFVGLPLFYLLTGVLNRALSRLVFLLRHRRNPHIAVTDLQVLPRPVRVLLVALAIRCMLFRFTLPLLERQFWSSAAAIITIIGAVWLLLRWSRRLESVIRRRRGYGSATSGPASVFRLGRRILDLLILFFGLLVILHHFGVNPTAALAGLGVGGIAIALAAQKTLENLIGGTSIILDRVVRVGDRLKIGDAEGLVEDIGLRSTRLRTLNRTVVSVPNGYLANASLENISMRDKFWFRQTLSLHKDTTAAQMREFLKATLSLLDGNSAIEKGTYRASFLAFGAFSLDVEIFAYALVDDTEEFLELQNSLLLRIMEILESTGIESASQSQHVQLTTRGDTDAVRIRMADSALHAELEPGDSDQH